MVPLLIILAFFLLILALLLLPVSLSVSLTEALDDVQAKLLIFGIPISLYPSKGKKKRNKKGARASTKKKAASQKKSKASDQTGSKDYVRLIRRLVRLVRQTHAHLYTAFRLKVCRARLLVASNDAAKTAILYGVYSQLAAALLEIAEQFVQTKRAEKEILVAPDFCATKTVCDIKLLLTTSAFKLLCYLLRSWPVYTRLKASEKNKMKHITEEPSNG